MRHVLLFVLLLFPLAAHAATVQMTWEDRSDNEDGFICEMRPQSYSTGSWTELGRVAANNTTAAYTVTTNQATCFRVVAFNKTGNSPASNEMCASAATVPAAPANMTIKVIIEVEPSEPTPTEILP